MDNRTNLLSSLFVAILAGLVYYVFNNETPLSDNFTFDTDTKNTVTSVAQSSSNFEKPVNSFVSVDSKKQKNQKLYRTLNKIKKQKSVKENELFAVVQEVKQNVEIDNTTQDLVVEYDTKGEDTFIVVRNKNTQSIKNKYSFGETAVPEVSEEIRIKINNCTPTSKKQKTKKSTSNSSNSGYEFNSGY